MLMMHIKQIFIPLLLCLCTAGGCKENSGLEIPMEPGSEDISFDISNDDFEMNPARMPYAVYRKDPDMKIYFLYPDHLKEGEERPAVVFFFGGGWVGGGVTQFAHQARILCNYGMVAAFVDYRVESRNQTGPVACVEDAKSAMRYLKVHASEHHIDPDRMAAAGGSAGGHLAAATAFVKAFNAPGDNQAVSPVPSALVLFNPVFNNAPVPEGWGYEKIKEHYPAISPAHNIGPGAPPTLIMLGTKDKAVPVSTAVDFQRKVEAQGALCELELYEGAEHAFFNYNEQAPKGGTYYQLTMQRTLKFLHKLGYISKCTSYNGTVNHK